MRIVGQNRVGSWPAFEANGVKLTAEVHVVRSDDRRRTVFLVDPRDPEQIEEAEQHPTSDEVMRIPYMVFRKKQAIIGGMAVRSIMRQQGVGTEFFQYFRKNIQEQDGLELTGSGKMHKPPLALILAHAGMTPKSMDCVVELLPSELAADPDVPLIRPLYQKLSPAEMKSASVYGDFYEMAPEGAFDYRPVDPSKVTALHTGFINATPPDQLAEAA